MIEMTSDTYQQLAAQIIPKGLNPLEMGRHAILGLVSRYTAFKGNSDLLDGLYTKAILAINKQERERVEARHKELLGELWRFFAELCTSIGLHMFKTISEKECNHWTFNETIGELADLYQGTYLQEDLDTDRVKELLMELGSWLKWTTEWQWLYEMPEIWEANIKSFQENEND